VLLVQGKRHRSRVLHVHHDQWWCSQPGKIWTKPSSYIYWDNYCYILELEVYMNTVLLRYCISHMMFTCISTLALTADFISVCMPVQTSQQFYIALIRFKGHTQFSVCRTSNKWHMDITLGYGHITRHNGAGYTRLFKIQSSCDSFQNMSQCNCSTKTLF